MALSELIERLDVLGALDAGIGPVKQRDRGATGGEVLAALAQCQLLGGHGLVAVDRQRVDQAAALLSALPSVPSTTAAGIARRFGPEQLAGIETGLATILARAVARMDDERRAQLFGVDPTIDMDSSEVEVYGRKKQGVAYNYAGQKAGRPHLATWAQAGVVLAGELLSGTDDVRPRAADLLRRALAALPDGVLGQGRRARLRADAGYFTGELALAAEQAGCDYAIAAKRNPAAWRAFAAIDDDAWVDAKDMPGAQVAAVDYRPEGWPPDAYTIVRRVRVENVDISHDVRSRRRRTIPAGQLTLALEGKLDHVYAVSFIVTNIPTGGDGFGSVVDVEAWFRGRVDIEDRIREAKLGAALRHLPSGHESVNSVWMWAAFTALNLSALLQALAGLDKHARAHGERLRRELLCVPARVIRHAGRLELRLPPGPQLLPAALARLYALPAA